MHCATWMAVTIYYWKGSSHCYLLQFSVFLYEKAAPDQFIVLFLHQLTFQLPGRLPRLPPFLQSFLLLIWQRSVECLSLPSMEHRLHHGLAGFCCLELHLFLTDLIPICIWWDAHRYMHFADLLVVTIMDRKVHAQCYLLPFHEGVSWYENAAQTWPFIFVHPHQLTFQLPVSLLCFYKFQTPSLTFLSLENVFVEVCSVLWVCVRHCCCETMWQQNKQLLKWSVLGIVRRMRKQHTQRPVHPIKRGALPTPFRGASLLWWWFSGLIRCSCSKNI